MADNEVAQPEREYYPTVSAVLVHDGKVLLRRDEQRYSWLAPSTHIGVDETPLDALFRHVKYETGLTQQHLQVLLPYADNLSLERGELEGTTQPMPFDLDIHQVGQDGHFHVDSSYILVSSTDELTPEVEVPPELQWFSSSELDDLMLTTTVTVSRAHYALQKYRDNPRD